VASDEGIGIWIRVMKASLRKLIKLPSGCVNEKLSDVITYLSWGQFESAFRELPIMKVNNKQLKPGILSRVLRAFGIHLLAQELLQRQVPCSDRSA
jgi:hypothetical protein